MTASAENVVSLKNVLKNLDIEKVFEQFFDWEKFSVGHILCPVYFATCKTMAKMLAEGKVSLVADKWHRLLLMFPNTEPLAYIEPTIGGFMISTCQQCVFDAAKAHTKVEMSPIGVVKGAKNNEAS